jgi:asparagine synthetase B (glutamine-hydrolysing)
MDLSLALALYFASRGAGTLSALGPSISSRRPYQSPAKVLLSGLGADEQLGGYARHRRAWENGKWEGVIDEVRPLALSSGLSYPS